MRLLSYIIGVLGVVGAVKVNQMAPVPPTSLMTLLRHHDDNGTHHHNGSHHDNGTHDHNGSHHDDGHHHDGDGHDHDGDDHDDGPSQGQMIDLVVSLARAIETSHVNAIDFNQTLNLTQQYLHKHNISVPHDELHNGLKQIFGQLDRDQSGNLTRKELLGGLFMMADHDGNAHMDAKEMCGLFKAYADFLNVKLHKGWRKHIKKWFNSIDKGVSFDELERFLKHSGNDISTLKGAVMSLDKNHQDHGDDDGDDDEDNGEDHDDGNDDHSDDGDNHGDDHKGDDHGDDHNDDGDNNSDDHGDDHGDDHSDDGDDHGDDHNDDGGDDHHDS